MVNPSEPLKDPSVTPPSKVPGQDQPSVGDKEATEPNKPFSLGPEDGTKGSEVQAERPSPMDVAKDSAQQQERMTPGELSEHVQTLQSNLSQIQSQLQDSSVTNKFTADHYNAMRKVVEKMTPDMKDIANNSEGEFQAVKPDEGEGGNVLKSIGNWIGGSQKTLGGALNYLSADKKPSIGSFMKLQYSVQRATQRGELFASIIGASVSGIKTIMSTQLG